MERRCARSGGAPAAAETRLFFQKATRHEFVSAVEQITGRKVRAFVSGLDPEEDIATEVFYLEQSS